MNKIEEQLCHMVDAYPNDMMLGEQVRMLVSKLKKDDTIFYKTLFF